MPVFKHEQVHAPQWDGLVNDLAAELRPLGTSLVPSSNPLTHPLPSMPMGWPERPAIYEDEIPYASAVHVLVVWDRWQDVPHASRGGIILEAYKQVDAPEGRTDSLPRRSDLRRARLGGHLPYSVQPTIRPTDRVDTEDVKAAMLELGGRRTFTGVELRFPFLSLAEAAMKSLQARFGEGTFCIAQEGGPVSDWMWR